MGGSKCSGAPGASEGRRSARLQWQGGVKEPKDSKNSQRIPGTQALSKSRPLVATSPPNENSVITKHCLSVSCSYTSFAVISSFDDGVYQRSKEKRTLRAFTHWTRLRACLIIGKRNICEEKSEKRGSINGHLVDVKEGSLWWQWTAQEGFLRGPWKVASHSHLPHMTREQHQSSNISSGWFPAFLHSMNQEQ